MTAKKNAKPAKPAKAAELIPVWVHDKGISGFDTHGAEVQEMEPNNYGYVKKLKKGVQPANTAPIDLKQYNTRQIKAKK